MREVREDSGIIRRIAFHVWTLAFLVCLAFLGFIVYGYIGDRLEGLPKVG